MSAHLRHRVASTLGVSMMGVSMMGVSMLAVSMLAALLTLAVVPLLPTSAAASEHAGHPSTAVQQRRTTTGATLTALPPIAQWGSAPASSRAAETTLVVELDRAADRAGRPLVLERRVHGQWREVDRARLRTKGRTVFTAPSRYAGEPAAYRVTAPAWRRWPQTRTPAADTAGWGDPAFLDEFDGAELGWRWQHRVQIHNPWGGRSCAKGADSAAAVTGGVLRLSVLPDPAEPEPCYTYDAEGNPLGDVPFGYRLNANISTERSADFQYGVAAARMRFQEARGQHAAFWLQPRGLSYQTVTSEGAEIDVVEWFGGSPGPDALVSTVYQPAKGETRARIGGSYRDPDRFLASRSDRWWRNYHVFSVEWTPTEYVFRIDGVETWRTSAGISHHPQFLVLSMLSSDHELAANPDARPEHAYVDWVAFWNLPPGS